MNQAALSRDEVDSLLSGIADPPPRHEPPVQDCDLAQQERIVSPDMPGLQAIHQRFVRELQDGLRAFARRPAEVSAAPIAVQSYAAFLAPLATPVSLSVLGLAPLRGKALLVCESSLICGLVDAMFGGSGRFPAQLEGRAFSATEQRIIGRLVDVVSNAYTLAWAPVQALQLVHERSETQPEFLDLARPNDIVLVSRYQVQCGAASGGIELCLPYAAFEPIAQALYTTARGEPDATERRWSAQLSHELQSAQVDLVAELAQTSATVRQLLMLKPGDFIELEISPNIRALVEGVPVFDCHYGTSAGRNAIKIDKPVAGPLTGRLEGPP